MTTFQDAPKSESAKLIDFKLAEIRPGCVSDTYLLVVTGTKPYLNMEIRLIPLVCVQLPDYWGFEVVGILNGCGLPEEAEYTVSIPIDGLRGKKGVEVIGATDRKSLDIPSFLEITRIGNARLNPAKSVSSQDAMSQMQSEPSFGNMEQAQTQEFEVTTSDSDSSESEFTVSTESLQPPDAYWGSYRGPKLEQVIGEENRIQITNTKEYPWRCICSLYITAADGNLFVGTGWLVSPRLLLTAGHCVYLHEHGGWARQIQVIPGRNGRERPFGSCITSNLRSVEGWTKKPTLGSEPDRNYDYGAILLAENFRYGDQLGYFGYEVKSDSELTQLKTNLAGYPSEDGKPVGTLWFDSQVLKDVNDQVLTYETDTGSGQSGAPVWIQTQDCNCYGIGIHTNGDLTGNSATRINQEVYKNIHLWVSEVP